MLGESKTCHNSFSLLTHSVISGAPQIRERSLSVMAEKATDKRMEHHTQGFRHTFLAQAIYGAGL